MFRSRPGDFPRMFGGRPNSPTARRGWGRAQGPARAMEAAGEFVPWAAKPPERLPTILCIKYVLWVGNEEHAHCTVSFKIYVLGASAGCPWLRSPRSRRAEEETVKPLRSPI